MRGDGWVSWSVGWTGSRGREVITRASVARLGPVTAGARPVQSSNACNASPSPTCAGVRLIGTCRHSNARPSLLPLPQPRNPTSLRIRRRDGDASGWPFGKSLFANTHSHSVALTYFGTHIRMNRYDFNGKQQARPCPLPGPGSLAHFQKPSPSDAQPKGNAASFLYPPPWSNQSFPSLFQLDLNIAIIFFQAADPYALRHGRVPYTRYPKENSRKEYCSVREETHREHCHPRLIGSRQDGHHKCLLRRKPHTDLRP